MMGRRMATLLGRSHSIAWRQPIEAITPGFVESLAELASLQRTCGVAPLLVPQTGRQTFRIRYARGHIIIPSEAVTLDTLPSVECDERTVQKAAESSTPEFFGRVSLSLVITRYVYCPPQRKPRVSFTTAEPEG
ncbi:hypothetical protein M8818_003655 [Zalaria obscura]|uniref:Uncharacterized protein n=1 Tax=Zalaria obscura TaxID=2024903 RepID=A0ACC3SFT2_9PEZI